MSGQDRQYTPPDERDFIDSWACRHVEYDIPADERADVARAFIAQARRDAAREALDGLADYIDLTASQFLGVSAGSQKAQDVRDYRDYYYPEVTP